MLHLTCTTITSVDLAHYGVSRAKDWVSVDCGTILICVSHICPFLNISVVQLHRGSASCISLCLCFNFLFFSPGSVIHLFSVLAIQFL